VRRANGRVRISAQLIDALEDRHLWVESYDHPLQDIFHIQSDVSRQIAQALAAELSAEEKASLEQRPTADVDAYDLYLKGRHLWGRRTVEGLQKSIQYFERALAHDPEFALAEAGRADSYVTLGMYGMRAPEEVRPLARESATRALSLDPRMAEASTALATVKALYDWDWSGAEREFGHAIEMQPNYPVAHQWLASNLLTPLGRFGEARAANERAGELDPLSEAIATTCGVIALYSAEYESAVQGLSEVLDVHERFGLAAFFRGQAEMELGRLDAAVDSLRLASQLTNSSSEALAMLAYAIAVRGQTAEARDILASLETRFADGYGSPVLKAQIHLGLGEHDRALDLLEEAVGMRAADLVWLGVRPIYRPLRDHARFEAILETVGLRSD
jgi:tetratricopeptide (TPR) repeat protein